MSSTSTSKLPVSFGELVQKLFNIQSFFFICLLALAGAQLMKLQIGNILEGLIIGGMGLWRIFTEKNSYQRKRITFIVAGVTLAWFVVPWIHPFDVPRIGTPEGQPFPGIHVFGTLTFFVFLIPVVLFGRGADCGWFCPCVALRETAGYPFRSSTQRTKTWWRLRHLKWPVMTAGLFTIPLAWVGGELAQQVSKPLNAFVFYGYWGSFILLPWLGNRNFCRTLCPFGAIWGLVGKIGFFRIEIDRDRCSGCRQCELACDMGIPLTKLMKKNGLIRSTECMGCGRCQNTCRLDAISLYDVRGKRNLPVESHPIALPQAERAERSC